MMRLNEIRKVQVKDLALKEEQIGFLEQKVLNKDSTIAQYEQRIKVSDKLTATYDASLANLTGQVGIQENQKEQLKRELKTANRKRVLNKIFYGAIAAVSLVLLAVK